ncbi:Gastrula zinc finger protein XlCGF46.1 [Armadillidium nasatum]|uniref:Gastrula zinc finger protein XlCGF46.1 n=1 Tax=Armadillidium nasatum TaxID=96803 RepID=A0A5N5SNG8_9CRUS|nr:Gastrula zinc finger protein XlCGF46.1 [Armadillidium nasatum]
MVKMISLIFTSKNRKRNYSFDSLLEEYIKEEPEDGDRLQEYEDSHECGNVKLELLENGNENSKSPQSSNYSNEESRMSFDNNFTSEMPTPKSGNYIDNQGLIIENMLRQSPTLMTDKCHIPQPIDLSVNNNYNSNNNRYFEEHARVQAVIQNIPNVLPSLPLGMPLLLKTLQNSLQQKHLNSLVMCPSNSFATFHQLLQHSVNIAHILGKQKKMTTEDGYSNLSDINYPEFKNENEEDSEELFCMDGIANASKNGNGELKSVLNIKESPSSLPTEFDKTDSDESKLFKCPTCSKQFLTKSRLTKHLLTHSEQCYSCSHCDFTTKRKDYLRVHELNHLETKMYKCSKCNFGTNVRSRLKIHENIHSEEKSFKCASCPYMTSRKDNLKLHELNHLETKRFKCDHCGYASNNKRNLKEHLMNHLDLKLFKCSDCPYETNKKGNLKLHQVKHVPKIPKGIIPPTFSGNPLPNTIIHTDITSNAIETADTTSSPIINPFILSSIIANSVIHQNTISNTETSREPLANLAISEDLPSYPTKSEEPISDPENPVLNPYSFKNLVNDEDNSQDPLMNTPCKEYLSRSVSN